MKIRDWYRLTLVSLPIYSIATFTRSLYITCAQRTNPTQTHNNSRELDVYTIKIGLQL
jgi:hypothetical protein